MKGLRNAKPGTYPAEPINPEELVSRAIVAEVPKPLWDTDWIVNMTNDIKFLDEHFMCEVGDYIWIQEQSRLTLKTDATDPNFKEIWVHYEDGQSRKTDLLPEEVKMLDRKIPPIMMKKRSCRFIVKVREIETIWADPEKRTRLIWVVGIERMPDAEYVLEQERRGCLK